MQSIQCLIILCACVFVISFLFLMLKTTQDVVCLSPLSCFCFVSCVCMTLCVLHQLTIAPIAAMYTVEPLYCGHHWAKKMCPVWLERCPYFRGWFFKTQKYNIGVSEERCPYISGVDLCARVYYWDLRNCREVSLFQRLICVQEYTIGTSETVERCPYFRGWFVCKSILLGPQKLSLIREVSLFQRLICAQKYTIGTSETVLIREVSLFQRLHKSRLLGPQKLSSLERCPYFRGWFVHKSGPQKLSSLERLFQRVICTQKWTSETVLIREVSLFQRCPLREVPLYLSCLAVLKYTYTYMYMYACLHVCTCTCMVSAVWATCIAEHGKTHWGKGIFFCQRLLHVTLARFSLGDSATNEYATCM